MDAMKKDCEWRGFAVPSPRRVGSACNLRCYCARVRRFSVTREAGRQSYNSVPCCPQAPTRNGISARLAPRPRARASSCATRAASLRAPSSRVRATLFPSRSSEPRARCSRYFMWGRGLRRASLAPYLAMNPSRARWMDRRNRATGCAGGAGAYPDSAPAPMRCAQTRSRSRWSAPAWIPPRSASRPASPTPHCPTRRSRAPRGPRPAPQLSARGAAPAHMRTPGHPVAALPCLPKIARPRPCARRERRASLLRAGWHCVGDRPGKEKHRCRHATPRWRAPAPRRAAPLRTTWHPARCGDVARLRMTRRRGGEGEGQVPRDRGGQQVERAPAAGQLTPRGNPERKKITRARNKDTRARFFKSTLGTAGYRLSYERVLGAVLHGPLRRGIFSPRSAHAMQPAARCKHSECTAAL